MCKKALLFDMKDSGFPFFPGEDISSYDQSFSATADFSNIPLPAFEGEVF